MEQTTLKVNGMSCGHCVGKVEKALKAVAGVKAAKVDLAKGEALVDFEAPATPEALRKAVGAAGYLVFS